MAEDRSEAHQSQGCGNTASAIQDISDVVERRERVLDDLAKTLRSFAQIQTESANILRQASAIVDDRQGDDRRYAMATQADQAEHSARQANERASRIERGDRFCGRS